MSNRIKSWIKSPRDLIAVLRNIASSVRRLETLEYILLFGLFLSCTTNFRVPFGPIDVSLTEIFAWLFILWRWTVGGAEDAKPDRGTRWLIWGFRVIAVWAGILWLFSNAWLLRREMFTNWLLAALFIDCLLRSPWKDWRRIAVLFVWAALPVAVWGVLQHAMGIGLAPKDLSGWGRDASSFPITGFFGHSNDLAAYLYWPLLVCAGLIPSFRSWRRVVLVLLTVLYGLVLYWTISRTTLLAVGLVAILATFVVLIPRRRIFLLASTGLAVLAAIAITVIFLTIPPTQINYFLSGRLDLWNQGLQLILSDKYLLISGYLAVPTANLQIWWLPHNIYTLAWIEFGVPGFLLLIGLAANLLYSGWKRYEGLRSHFSAAVVWAGMAGLFLINGMADLYFHESYVIINFLCVTALWTVQLRQIDSSASQADSTGPGPEKSIPDAAVSTEQKDKQNLPDRGSPSPFEGKAGRHPKLASGSKKINRPMRKSSARGSKRN